MWKWLHTLSEKLRKKSYTFGYGCDFCGAELFDYPVNRFCADCASKMRSPKRACPKCGREGRSTGICSTCKNAPPKYKRGISAFVYRGQGAIAVNRMKNGEARLSAYFGESMADAFLAQELEYTQPILIFAVPTTKSSLEERGYNQAELLAESVQNRLEERGISTERKDGLKKVRETQAQKKMAGKERAKNVEGAYALRNRGICKGRTVLLVDDILTTGATGNECAKKIIAAGAREVYFLTATSVPER